MVPHAALDRCVDFLHASDAGRWPRRDGLWQIKPRKLLNEAHGRVTFDDVAGIDEAKDDLQEIVEFLKDPTKFQRLGGRIPKGCA